jgi:hypothetical protein
MRRRSVDELAFDVAVAHEGVEDASQRRRGDRYDDTGRDLRRCEWFWVTSDDVQHVEGTESR